MFNFFATFLAIIGTVIGSGFISGKEIVVFFTRFGLWSFPCIALCFVLLYLMFRILLFKGNYAVKKLEKSKLSFFLNFFVCLIFSASMFAGSIDMARGQGKFVTMIFLIALFLVCYRVVKHGAKSLNKINFILVPAMTIVLLTAVVFLIFKGGEIEKFNVELGGFSFLYCILYVVLNTSNSCVLIGKLGQSLSSKQKTRVAFFSALVLSLILLALNIILLKEPQVLQEDMPLLSLFTGVGKGILSFAILIGCLTTLFSLVYCCSFSLRGLCKNEILIFLVSVVLPYLLSFLGFGFIVSQLYPLASIIGLALLIDSFFIPLFKGRNNKVHSNGKQT